MQTMMVSLPCLRRLQFVLLVCFILTSNTIIKAYDSSSMQYHPDGRVLQIEYSKDAVKKGGPIGAYRCKDGIIVVAVRKSPISKFLVHPMQKVFRIDSNIIIAATGLLFDANVIVDVAKRICLQHRNIYCEEMPVENLCEDLSEIMHKQTTGNSRPFGVSFIVAGIDSVLGHQLYVLDPEGSVNAWNTVCIGKDSDKVMETFLETFAKTTDNKDLSVVETWPKFQACLRKHFPGKLEVSASILKLQKEAKRINALIELENSGEKNLEQDMDDELIRQPAYEPVSDSSRKNDQEDSSTEYWELEVSSLMLNSQKEVCFGSLQLPLEPSSALQNGI